MKKQQFFQSKISKYSLLAVLILLMASLTISSSCNGGDEDDIEVSVDNLSFDIVMEETPYFRAEELSVSPNGQYIVASVKIGTSFNYYQSINSGESFSELIIDAEEVIATNISNNGKFILKNAVVNLVDGSITGIKQISSGLDHFITESGKVLSFQGRSNDVKLYEAINGELIEIAVEINFNPGVSAGVSGEKIGFFQFQLGSVIREFDASTNTITENQLSVDYSQIGGGVFRGSSTKTAYSEGYFALAKEGGCLTISPDLEISYYPYPSEYTNFMNTSAMVMLGKRIYVPLFKGTGEKKVFEIDGGELKETELSFPIAPLSDGLLTTGFIENGDRAFSGLIKYRGGVPSYLAGNINTPEFNAGPGLGTAHEIGNYIYFNNTRYNQLTGTYSISPFNTLKKVVYLDNGHLVYGESGPHLSRDNGETWTSITTEPFIQPTYVVKDEAGIYYGLVVTFEVGTINGDIQVIGYGHEVYTSSDPTTSWTLIPGSEKRGFDRAPEGCSSDGTIRVIDNLAPSFGNAESTIAITKDFGVTYETYSFSDAPTDRTSQFETAGGKKVVIKFAAGGIMTVELGSLRSDEFSITEITLPTELSSARDYSATKDGRILLSGRSVYKSSKL